MRKVACGLLTIALISAAAVHLTGGRLPNSAGPRLEAALRILHNDLLHRDKVDWSRVWSDTLSRARTARSPMETCAAIWHSLDTLGGWHDAAELTPVALENEEPAQPGKTLPVRHLKPKAEAEIVASVNEISPALISSGSPEMETADARANTLTKLRPVAAEINPALAPGNQQGNPKPMRIRVRLYEDSRQGIEYENFVPPPPSVPALTHISITIPRRPPAAALERAMAIRAEILAACEASRSNPQSASELPRPPAPCNAEKIFRIQRPHPPSA